MLGSRCGHLSVLGTKDVFQSINECGKHMPCVDKVLSQFSPISKRMVVSLRHSVELREEDGGDYWNTWMQNFRGFEQQIANCSDDWEHCLLDGTDTMRFEYCLDRKSRIRYMRSI